MTLPLRKKRQTTLRNIAKRQINSAKRQINAANRLIKSGLFGLVLVSSAAQLSPVFAADASWNNNSGTKLTWRPARTAKNEAPISQAVDVSPVRTAKYEQDVFDDAPAAPTRIRLTAGSSATVRNVATDVFDDNLPSVQTHKPSPSSSRNSSVRMDAPRSDTTRIEPDTFENLPPPTMREVQTIPQFDSAPAHREPLELSPPDPLKSGALRHTIPTNQTPDPFVPNTPDTPDFSNPQAPQRTPEENCKIEYDKIKAYTINKLSLDINVKGRAGTDLPFECGLTTDSFQPRCWRNTTYTWKASALCHKPLYFEDEALERYGHSHGPVCEYVSSFAHFFGDVALLPYHVGVETPCECIYDLGVYRPGNCAPYMLDPFPFSLRGAATAAVGYCGVIALLP